jgi:hypothetical protein
MTLLEFLEIPAILARISYCRPFAPDIESASRDQVFHGAVRIVQLVTCTRKGRANGTVHTGNTDSMEGVYQRSPILHAGVGGLMRDQITVNANKPAFRQVFKSGKGFRKSFGLRKQSLPNYTTLSQK